jgi:sulfite exporter TauE/SafE
MKTDKNTGRMDIRLKLSLLWIFMLLHMVYADILSLLDETSPIRSVMAGASLPSGGLIAGAIVMETALIMIFLSHVLKRNANRVVTTIMAVLNIIFVVTGGHGLYYLFFASIEVASLLLIIGIVWTWKKPEKEDTSAILDAVTDKEDASC